MAATFNFYEAILWFIIAIYLTASAFLNKPKKPYQKNLIIVALLFFAFGVSDLIEIQTGAWWKPLGLLILKGGCILGFIFCFFRYNTIKKQLDTRSSSSDQK